MMPGNEPPLDEYLKLANDLYEGRITETDISSATVLLPTLDKNLLEQLTQHTESLSTIQPRAGWAVSFVACNAAVNQRNLFLRCLAAWYLARACNHWAQPKRVKEAISIARHGFEELNETSWLSACDWQANALAWTQPNFPEAARKLKEALSGLEAAGFTEFIPDCRLPLAYAQILIGEHDAAMENIRLSEETYTARGDALNQARCWLNQASSLRRRDRFEEAHQKLEGALAIFEQENALTEQGKARYQMALGHMFNVQVAEAVSQFTQAAELFQRTKLDLWHGLCINNLGSVYLFTGELTLADGYYQEAERTFLHHEIDGSLADNLNDHGEVNILRGNPQMGIELFKRSVELNEKLGARSSMAVATTNLGKAYGQNGRYQDALFHLEQASEQLASLYNHLRLGTCEKYAALIWSHLGQPAMTHEHLDRAIHNYELAGQKAMLSEIHNVRATAYFQQGQMENAIACLKDSLAVSLEYGVRPQTALARRLLGEALAQAGRYEEALGQLELAYADFSEMGMQMDMAACRVASGMCYASTSQQDQASDAFQGALQLSEGILPENEWKAHIGLGDLALSRTDTTQALSMYRLALIAFSRIRQNFWQPALAGSYLQRPARVFDAIISFTSTVNAVDDALLFIETSKASTLSGQLLTGDLLKKDSTSQELLDLEAEIRFMQDQLRTSLDQPFPVKAGSEFRQVRVRLAEKTRLFEQAKARLERQVSQDGASAVVQTDHFDVGQFREWAKVKLQRNWFALDYYLLDDHLVTVVIGADRCEVTRTPLSHRFRMALETCKRAAQNPALLTQADLDVLGKTLLPSCLVESLTPDTFLIVSPHKELHTVPWAALRSDSSPKPLVQLCIPSIVPSLRSLSLIWQRNTSALPDMKNGLVIGLSSFEGKRRELPHTKDELSFLSTQLGTEGVCLAEKDARWENLLKLNQATGEGENRRLSRFAWTHIASHFFSHAQTGRLSGLALWDGDVWLDQLRDLSPLPGLVTLSACNSISSFVYGGDEHVDLPSTCLMAGAHSVVGSLWLVLDHAAAEFTVAFYKQYLAGKGPAESVALAQREAMEQGVPLSHWAGFTCIGEP